MSTNRSSRRGVGEEERSHSSHPQTPIRQSSLGMQPSTPSSSSGTTTTTRTRFGERRAAETATIKIDKLEKAKAGLGLGPPPLVVDPYNHHHHHHPRVEVVRPNDEDGARHRNFKERTAERKAARNARPNIQHPHRQPSTGTLYSLEQKPPSSSSINNQASVFSNNNHNEQGPLNSNSTLSNGQPGAVAVIYQDRPHTTSSSPPPPPRRHEEDRVNDDDDDAIHNDEQETLVAARVVQEENRALHAYVAEPAAPLQQAAAPIVWPDEVESIDPKQTKGTFVISRRCCWILLIVVILVIATVSTVMGFLLGSSQPNTNNNNNNAPPPPTTTPPIAPTNSPTETTTFTFTSSPTTSNVFIANSPTAFPSSPAEPSLGIATNSSRIEGGPKCSFCYQDDSSTYNSLQLIFNKVLVPNDEISCLEFQEEVNRIEANDASCPVGQSLTWKHCGCPQLPPYSSRRPPRNNCPICGKSENPTTNTTQCDNEQRYVEMVGTAIPELCPILANNAGRVCSCPEAPADPPSNRTNATNTVPVDDTIIGNIGNRFDNGNRFGVGNRIDIGNQELNLVFNSRIGQPIGVPMNPAAPSSVAYMVSWAGATNACGGDGVVSPTMNVSCGNGGSLEMLNTTDQQGDMLSCHNTSMSTAICSTDLTGAADRFDASVTFLCTGSSGTQWQGAVQAPALHNIVCNGSVVDHFATHGVSISYYDFQADMIMSNSTCVSDFETSGGVCYSAASCNSSTTTNASNCTTTVPSVGVSQNTPIPMSARFQAVTPGMAPTPAPTPPEQTFACPLANQTVYRLELLTDYFPQETGWELRRLEDDTVVAVPASSSLPFALTEYAWRGCVNTTSCYRLTITDSAGDGLCCDYGMGNYTLIYNNETIQTGGEFGFQDVALIGSNCEPYTVPSASPSSSSP